MWKSIIEFLNKLTLLIYKIILMYQIKHQFKHINHEIRLQIISLMNKHGFF